MAFLNSLVFSLSFWLPLFSLLCVDETYAFFTVSLLFSSFFIIVSIAQNKFCSSWGSLLVLTWTNSSHLTHGCLVQLFSFLYCPFLVYFYIFCLYCILSFPRSELYHVFCRLAFCLQSFYVHSLWWFFFGGGELAPKLSFVCSVNTLPSNFYLPDISEIYCHLLSLFFSLLSAYTFLIPLL